MEKYVLITGASSGLGKETAQKLAQEGYKVFAGARKQTDIEALNALHENITAIPLDVTVEESVNQAVETVKAKTDKIYALVNNAGIALGGPIEYLPIEALQNQFNINVFGAIRVAQKFMPLLKGNSRIVNISSMASYAVFPYVSPYCASKRALDIFFNSLLIENKNPDLKIISVKPGVVATPIWNKSVDACEKCFEGVCQEARDKYQKELDFIAQNARNNTNKGLKSADIANLVSKILKSKNPKLSYNIGKDSYFAKFLSCLPLSVSNAIVKFGLKHRVN